MKVFVSSLITGMGSIRSAVRRAVETLRHTPVMAEDFGAQPNSPQVACLTGLRECDLVVLVLGARYGPLQESGMSATHEEYEAAKETKPIIAFVQESVEREPKQSAFVTEVEAWSGGLFRGGFRDADDLQVAVTRALYDHALTTAAGPIDPGELERRLMELLSPAPHSGQSGAPSLSLAVVGGPAQQILRPVEIERPELRDGLHQAALFGAARIFDPVLGVTAGMNGATLSLAQERSARVQLDQNGDLRLALPIERPRGPMSMPVLIEEEVQAALDVGLTYAALVLDKIDPTDKLTQVGIAARIDGGEYQAWRTRAEHEASSQSVSLGHSAGAARSPESLIKPRASLRLNRSHLVEDLLVPLRRQWRGEASATSSRRGGVRFI